VKTHTLQTVDTHTRSSGQPFTVVPGERAIGIGIDLLLKKYFFIGTVEKYKCVNTFFFVK